MMETCINYQSVQQATTQLTHTQVASYIEQPTLGRAFGAGRLAASSCLAAASRLAPAFQRQRRFLVAPRPDCLVRQAGSDWTLIILVIFILILLILLVVQ